MTMTSGGGGLLSVACLSSLPAVFAVNMAVCSVFLCSVEMAARKSAASAAMLSPSYANLRVAIGADGTVLFGVSIAKAIAIATFRGMYSTFKSNLD